MGFTLLCAGKGDASCPLVPVPLAGHPASTNVTLHLQPGRITQTVWGDFRRFLLQPHVVLLSALRHRNETEVRRGRSRGSLTDDRLR